MTELEKMREALAKIKGEGYSKEGSLKLDITESFPVFQNIEINCDKHGVHGHIITSNIKGYEGNFCKLCWLDALNKCELAN